MKIVSAVATTIHIRFIFRAKALAGEVCADAALRVTALHGSPSDKEIARCRLSRASVSDQFGPVRSALTGEGRTLLC
jgi:hypothetical protein